jgi:hypothetical protein
MIITISRKGGMKSRGLTASVLAKDGHHHLPGESHGDMIEKRRGKEINICDPFSDSDSDDHGHD